MEVPDQPVLAWSTCATRASRSRSSPPTSPRRRGGRARAIRVEYEVLEPLRTPRRRWRPARRRCTSSGNVLRHVRINHGDPDATADVVVTGEYEVGMQDQAFLGPESGLAVPDAEGGVDLYIATQWLHVDRDQVAESLGLPPREGAVDAGGRRRRVRRPRGPVDADPRVPARAPHAAAGEDRLQPRGVVLRPRPPPPVPMRYEHGATRDGRLVYVRARIVLDGGAYASSSTAVCSNAACFAAGPYDVPNARIDGYVTYTNNPPCGAMRGFGAVQVAVGHEAQMDKLAAALGIDPVELRIRNAMQPGSLMPTGQVDPRARAGRRAARAPARDAAAARSGRGRRATCASFPAESSNTTHGEGVRRGVGYGLGFKNVGFSEGFDDYSTARVRLSLDGGEPLVEVHTAAAEVGQGVITVQAQIARTELGVERVAVSVRTRGSARPGRARPRARPTSPAAPSRRPARPCASASSRCGPASGRGRRGRARRAGRGARRSRRPSSGTTARPYPLDENGQGDAHLQFAFSAHRAVVDVDPSSGSSGSSSWRPRRRSARR